LKDQDAFSFGVVLRSHRVAAGLTQEALAERSGLGVRSIQGLERDETHPRRETLQRMAVALELTGERLAAFEVAGQPPARPPLATRRVRAETGERSGIASAPRHNLPSQLTTFVGREGERADLNDRLTTTRLLTLTGTGGCGKTRLALEVAADAVTGFPDGVWLVELAALSDPALIAKAVATAIGVREAADRPVRETLLAALQLRRLLLVVDNCEHLREGCAALVEALLRTCPGVTVLATSREPLGLDGEVAWRVPSLTVAPDERWVEPAQLRAYEAVRLFLDRARAAELSPPSRSPSTTPERSLRSAAVWTASRWRLSWRRDGPARCLRIRSPSASTGGSTCSPAAVPPRSRGSKHSRPRSTGATTT
jgi:transcriptional regulator with XRE-family HTH domain